MNDYSLRVRAMVFNTTFNNNSVISWRLVSLFEEAEVPPETTYSINAYQH
jgi:hypothetical protein